MKRLWLILFILLTIAPWIVESETISQRAFTGGELAPALQGRIGLDKYQSGLNILRNFYIKKHGGATNRPGTGFVGEVKYSELPTRLIPFIFNNEQTYVLEFGDQYVRFIQNGGHVLENSINIVSIDLITSSIGVTAHGYETGDWVFLNDLDGTDELDYRTVSIVKLTDDNFTIHEVDGTPIDTSGYTPYVGNGTVSRIYTLSTPYFAEDLAELNYVQSADVVTIVNQKYPPKELTRYDNTNWTLTDIDFIPTVSTPHANRVTGGPAGSETYVYHVTAFQPETGEESYASVVSKTATTKPTTASPHTIEWEKNTDEDTYYLYLEENEVPGFIGIGRCDASPCTFKNDGIDPETTDTPPEERLIFQNLDNYPATVGYIQQRLAFANTVSNPEKVYMSQSGRFKNFSRSNPIQDDDAVTFTMVGKQNHSIKHLLDLGRMILFSTGGEWSVLGDQAGIIKPGEINPKQHSYNGSGNLAPIVANDTALYLQERGSIIRDLLFNFNTDGYTGGDLTVYSNHLFEGHIMVAWAYQKVPNPIVWIVRDDGVVLSLSYDRNQEMLAWARHDFDNGRATSVAIVPEGKEDVPYFIVERVIGNRITQYVERLSSRLVLDINDAKFMDSYIGYDGRNTDVFHFMTITSVTENPTWAYDEVMQLNSDTDYFKAEDVGREIHLTGSDGTIIRFAIENVSNGFTVGGKPDKTVTVPMRAVSINNWSKALKTLRSLWHLEGESLSIIGDGYVVGSPKNDDYTLYTVSQGEVTMQNAYTHIYAGLPYVSDMQTLNVNSVDGESLSDRKMKVDSVTMLLEKSRGGWAGANPPDDSVDPLQGLSEVKIRQFETQDEPVKLRTDFVKIQIAPEWNSNGRVFVRQIDPLPMTILTIEPNGWFPFRRDRRDQ